jgi:hypothetical protein
MIRTSLFVVVVVAALGTPVLAQETGTGVTDIVEGAGIKVGEGTVLHPILGIDSGIVYNVFYEDGNEGPVTSGLLRLYAAMAVGSLPSERLQTVQEEDDDTKNYGDLAFRADLYAQYEEYLSSRETVRSQRDITLGLMLRGIVFPRRTWQFGFHEEFRRDPRPVNFESDGDVDRDTNIIGVELRYRPYGRALSGDLRYRNHIDYFEDDSQQFANRMQHTIGLQVGWKLFPVTRLYGDASLGFAGGFGSASTRPSSMPLRILVGIQSALTVKTTINAKLGFGKGFYDSGPDFTMVTGGAQFGYRFSPNGRGTLMYDYDFHDSINANYYTDHAIKLKIDQLIGRFGVSAAAELRFRHYAGVIMEVDPARPNRDDLIFSVPLGVNYHFRNWIAATLDYRFTTDQTDFRYMPEPGVIDDPSYTRHLLLAGVRAAY